MSASVQIGTDTVAVITIAVPLKTEPIHIETIILLIKPKIPIRIADNTTIRNGYLRVCIAKLSVALPVMWWRAGFSP